jgi:hypothetical protein
MLSPDRLCLRLCLVVVVCLSNELTIKWQGCYCWNVAQSNSKTASSPGRGEACWQLAVMLDSNSMCKLALDAASQAQLNCLDRCQACQQGYQPCVCLLEMPRMLSNLIMHASPWGAAQHTLPFHQQQQSATLERAAVELATTGRGQLGFARPFGRLPGSTVCSQGCPACCCLQAPRVLPKQHMHVNVCFQLAMEQGHA